MRSIDVNIESLPESLEVPTRGSQILADEVGNLFDNYRAPLYRFLLSMGLACADAEESIQEVFLALYKHLRDGKPRLNLRAWLFQVTHNQGRKLQRRRPAPVLMPAEITTPEQQAIENQQRRRIAAAMLALPELERACIALRAEGMRYREIAEVLQISTGGVALQLERALARIQKAREG